MNEALNSDIASFVWNNRYRQRTEANIEATWRRVAQACAAIEGDDAPLWQENYLQALSDFRFLPGGRILAGAGTGQRVTLFNCFVMGHIDDTLNGICDALKEGTLTMQQGGGIGCDFSTLRPRGAQVRDVGRIASGPVSFMRVWDSMCSTLVSTSARGGAMMATLRCDHPDILDFVQAKCETGQLTCFNLSVQVSDAFIEAVKNDREWSLVFPAAALDGEGETIERQWPGYEGSIPCRVLKKVSARELWQAITRSAYDCAEPGVLFIDRINRLNNLGYREHISATNPCGEIPLPPYGACDLGSINLTCFVREPFSPWARIDLEAIRQTTRSAVRLLDSVIDISHYPLLTLAEQAQGTRRIGLGITGLADALILLGLHYDSEQARSQAAEVMKTICHSAYESSIDLAREKGAFPYFEREPYLASAFIRTLPAAIRDGIARYGIRNSHLTAIAPAGSISVLANNVSTGIEPVFDFSYRHRVRVKQGREQEFEVEDYARRRWREQYGADPLPDYFVAARSLSPQAHIAMEAALQPYIDNSISKTINIPADYPYAAFRDIYLHAYERGLKGCTVYRPSAESRAPLQSSAKQECGLYCGDIS